MSVCVFQVLGSVRSEAYEEVVYEHGGVRVESRLSGDALCGLLGGGSCKLYLLAPESLIAQLPSDVREASRLVRDWGLLAERVSEVVHGWVYHAEGVKVLPLPSGGVYQGTWGRVVFKGVDHNDAELAITMYLLQTVSYSGGAGCDTVIFDLSTGLNVYVSVAMKALRSLVAGLKLANLDCILFGEGFKPRIYMAFASPVQRGYRGPYTISVEEVDARIFFTFPLNHEELKHIKPHNLVRSLEGVDPSEFGRRWATLVKEVKRVLGLGLILHNALRYNAPLALYYAEEIHGEHVDAQKPLELAKRLAEMVAEEAWRNPRVTHNGDKLTVKHRGANRRLTLYTLLALLETSALIRLRQRLVQDVDLSKGVAVEELRRVFAETIYVKDPNLSQDLALNARMLERDLGELIDAAEALPDGQCTLYTKLLEGIEETKTTRRPKRHGVDRKRNFFAHSGLLRDITEVCKTNGRLLVRYKLDKTTIDELTSWLKNPF